MIPALMEEFFGTAVQTALTNKPADFSLLEGLREPEAADNMVWPFPAIKVYSQVYGVTKGILKSALFAQGNTVTVSSDYFRRWRMARLFINATKGKMEEAAIIDFLTTYYSSENFRFRPKGWLQTEEQCRYIAAASQAGAIPSIIIYGYLMNLTVQQVTTYVKQAGQQVLSDFQVYAHGLSGIGAAIGLTPRPFLIEAAADKQLLRLMIAGRGYLQARAETMAVAMEPLLPGGSFPNLEFIRNKVPELNKLLDLNKGRDSLRRFLTTCFTYDEIVASNARRATYENGKRNHLIKVTAGAILQGYSTTYNLTGNANLGNNWVLTPNANGELKKGMLVKTNGSSPGPDALQNEDSLLGRIYRTNKQSDILRIETAGSWHERSIPANLVNGKYGDGELNAWHPGRFYDPNGTEITPRYNNSPMITFEFQHKLLVSSIKIHYKSARPVDSAPFLNYVNGIYTQRYRFALYIIEALDASGSWIGVSNEFRLDLVPEIYTIPVTSDAPHAAFRLVGTSGTYWPAWFVEVEFVTREI